MAKKEAEASVRAKREEAGGWNSQPDSSSSQCVASGHTSRLNFALTLACALSRGQILVRSDAPLP